MCTRNRQTSPKQLSNWSTSTVRKICQAYPQQLSSTRVLMVNTIIVCKTTNIQTCLVKPTHSLIRVGIGIKGQAVAADSRGTTRLYASTPWPFISHSRPNLF